MKFLELTLALGLGCCFSEVHAASPLLVSKSLASRPSVPSSSGGAVFSANGRFLVFISSSDALVPENSNGPILDVFVYDVLSKKVELISVDVRGGNGGNADSGEASVSADGRFVAFSSRASNLVDAESDGMSHIYLRDRAEGTTLQISEKRNVQGIETRQPGDSTRPWVTHDGGKVLFVSESTQLAEADSRPVRDLYVWRRDNNSLEVLSGDWPPSVPGPGGVGSYAVSSDGNQVAYHAEGSRRLVAPAREGVVQTDVFIRTLLSGAEQRLSIPKSTSGMTTAALNSIAFLENPVRLATTWRNAAPMIVSLDPIRVEPFTARPLPNSEPLSYPLNAQAIVSPGTALLALNALALPTATAPGAIQIWSHEGPATEWMKPFGSNLEIPAEVLRISPTGRFVAVLSESLPTVQPPALPVRRLVLYDLEHQTFEILQPSKIGAAEDETIAGLNFSPDERYLAFESASDDWSVEKSPGSTELYLHEIAGKAPPAFRLQATLVQGQLSVQWPSTPGQRYVVEMKTPSIASDWTAVGEVKNGTGAALTANVEIRNDSRLAFFRVRIVPE